MKTTAFVNHQGQDCLHLEKCHDGEGPFKLRDIISSLPEKQFIKFIHDDIIPPGSSFGLHQHKSEVPVEEWYFCISGHGVMTLDGRDHEMGPGDISVCYANGSHSVKNTGTEELRILVIYAAPI